jgi:RNA polymerase sigma-70 factor, ECF subfamily
MSEATQCPLTPPDLRVINDSSVEEQSGPMQLDTPGASPVCSWVKPITRPENTPMDLASGTDPRQSPKRDARAIAALFEEHNPFVLKRLHRYGVRNPADLEEESMRVWEIVIDRYVTFRGEAAVTTWLSEICRRVASDFRRSAWVRRAWYTPDGKLLETAPTDDELERLVRVIDALSLLATLSPMHRNVLVLYYAEDRTASEIADTLGASPREVYANIEMALARLEKLPHRKVCKETP